MKPLLKIVGLQVAVETKKVIEDLDLTVGGGEVVVIGGANGGGKSSLAMALMGDARYKVADTEDRLDGVSKVEFDGKDLLKMSADERSRAGLFVSWQTSISIPGISVFSLCKASYEAHGKKIDKLVAFKNYLEELASKVGLPKEYVARNVNDGFSGGEKKRLELLQLLLLSPKLAILDEIDSGLDANGVKILIKIIKEMKTLGTSFVLITHNKKLLEDELVDKTLEMRNGRLSTGI